MEKKMSEPQVQSYKPFYKRTWFIITAALLFVAVLAKFGSESKPQKSFYDSETKADKTPVSAAPVKPIEETYAEQPNIGVIKQTGSIVKVEQYEGNADVNNQFHHPKEGNQFLAFKILLDNSKGKKDLTLVASGSFRLKDNQDMSYKAEVIIGKEPMFNPMNDIKVGEKSRGWVTFDVPKNIPYNKYKIMYEFLGDETDWITIK